MYCRAITYRALRQIEQAKIDLVHAIHLAQTSYEKDPSNWQNTFNLALYHLAAEQDEQAKYFYRDALHRKAPIRFIQDAIQDLDDFLISFPDHAFARLAYQALQKELQKRLASS